MHVTWSSAASVMLATLPEVLTVEPPVSDWHDALTNVHPVGFAPSVTVYEPARTLLQSSVLAVLSELVFPLSFSEKESAVVSVVQANSLPALAVVMFDVKPKAWFPPRG